MARKGVEVRTNAAVTSVDATGVVVGGEYVASSNVIWTAGVVGTPLGRALGVPVDRHGRVQVQPDLSIMGHPEVFVIGDLMVVEQDGKPFAPGVAPVAIQQGAYVGTLIARRVAGQAAPGPFRYWNKGNLATIGRSFAIADLGSLKLSGRLAWLLWLLVHLYIPGDLVGSHPGLRHVGLGLPHLSARGPGALAGKHPTRRGFVVEASGVGDRNVA